MTRTKIDGKWVNDAQKDYSGGKPRPVNPAQTNALIVKQNQAMKDALASVSQCKNITQVRQALAHARSVYPTK